MRYGLRPGPGSQWAKHVGTGQVGQRLPGNISKLDMANDEMRC